MHPHLSPLSTLAAGIVLTATIAAHAMAKPDAPAAHASAPPATAAALDPAAPPAAAERRVCRRIETPGTRLRTRTTCRTPDAWRALDRQGRGAGAKLIETPRFQGADPKMGGERGG